MKTRSQPKQPAEEIYEVKIDFDGASQSWRENKKSIGNGTYKYICISLCKSGKKCNRTPLSETDFCKLHFKNVLKDK